MVGLAGVLSKREPNCDGWEKDKEKEKGKEKGKGTEKGTEKEKVID